MRDIVHIYEPKLDIVDLTMKPAKIGWGSIQPVTPNEAREFASRVMEAADKADWLNRKLEGR